MANKISTIIGKIVTGLETLVPGTLQAVEDGVVNYQTVDAGTLPRAAVFLGEARPGVGPPSSAEWTATVYILLATRAVEGTARHQTIMDLVKAVETAVHTVREGGSAGGKVGPTRWEAYPYPPGSDPATLVASGRLDVETSGGL